MPTFNYVAIATDGSEKTGAQRAKTLTEARIALEEQNLTVIDLSLKSGILQLELGKSRIKPNELMHLSRQLSAFIRAGIPILDAIQEIGDSAESRGVKRVMTQIGDDLKGGARLTEAFSQHPHDFPTYYLGILQSAEVTGQLDTVLDQLAAYLERDLEARRKLKSAMIYPSIVAMMAALTITVLTLFVMPKFKVFFESLNAELPLPTRLLLSGTAFLGQWAWLGGLLLAALIITYVVGVRIRRGRYIRDAILLHIPVLGGTLRYALIERFTRILASMVAAGVPMPRAMQVSIDSLSNLVYEDKLNVAREEMMAGGGLGGPIADTKLLPAMAVQMIKVGEDTGNLDTQLEVAAQYYERELDYKIKKLATIIEPVVIIFMGGIVGFVAVALVSAMYGIFRAANVG